MSQANYPGTKNLQEANWINMCMLGGDDEMEI